MEQKEKKILQRSHPPISQQKLVYKPIVNQNQETMLKEKNILVDQDFPPLSSNLGHQALVIGECSKTSTNNALPADLFSGSGVELEDGEICVDLSGFGALDHSLSSSSSEDSLPDSLSGSGDEDKPNDGHDKYIEVISKRFKRQSKYKDKSRARGPLTL